MLNAVQYAEKYGYKAATVKQWCKEGNLPGVQKVPTGRKGIAAWAYMIPEDARPLRQLRVYQKKCQTEEPQENVQPPPVLPLKTLRTRREKCEHIRKYCISRTYKQLCAETGMTREEVRQVYDRIHEVDGI